MFYYKTNKRHKGCVINQDLSISLQDSGLGSHCKKGLAPAPAQELSSITSVSPAPAPQNTMDENIL